MKGKLRGPSVIKAKLNFANYNVYVHSTPEDGHCMLHAIAMAIYPPYYTNDTLTKVEIVKQIRREILERMEEKNTKTGKSNYESIADGAFARSASWNIGSNMSHLKKLFSSSQQLGEEAKIILEFFIEKNILVINASTNKLYLRHDFDKNRSSIILYYSIIGENANGDQTGHFELVSVQDPRTGELVRHFQSSDPFIEYLQTL